MRKLIQIKQEFLIQCDNTKCGFIIPYKEEYEKFSYRYINIPCPFCGENLLTQEDYLMSEKLNRGIKFINKWFSWLTIFQFGKPSAKKISVHVHKGLKIEKYDQKTARNSF